MKYRSSGNIFSPRSNYINIFKKPDSQCDSGDLNQDTITDILDAIMMVNFIMDENATGFEFCLSDLNEDNIINVIDIIALINIIIAIIYQANDTNVVGVLSK